MISVFPSFDTVCSAINQLPGPGRIARLIAAALFIPSTSASASFLSRRATPLVGVPSFQTFPYQVSGSDFFYSCGNTTGVLTLGEERKTFCHLESGLCDTLPDPSGSSFIGSTVVPKNIPSSPCNTQYWAQSYTDTGGPHVRIGQYTGSSFTVIGSSPASVGATEFTTSSVSVSSDGTKFYVGSGYEGDGDSGYIVTRLYDSGNGGVDSHKEKIDASSTGNVVGADVYTVSWISPLGSRRSVIVFAIDPDDSSQIKAQVSDGNFGSAKSVSVTSNSATLSSLQTQEVSDERFVMAAIGDGAQIHLNLMHMPAESKTPSQLDSLDLSLGPIDHIAISRSGDEGGCKLYWSSGGTVSVGDISTDGNGLSITGKGVLFDLGNVNLDALSVGAYQDGSQVVAVSVGGEVKVWEGNVMVPKTQGTRSSAVGIIAGVVAGVALAVLMVLMGVVKLCRTREKGGFNNEAQLQHNETSRDMQEASELGMVNVSRNLTQNREEDEDDTPQVYAQALVTNLAPGQPSASTTKTVDCGVSCNLDDYVEPWHKESTQESLQSNKTQNEEGGRQTGRVSPHQYDVAHVYDEAEDKGSRPSSLSSPASEREAQEEEKSVEGSNCLLLDNDYANRLDASGGM